MNVWPIFSRRILQKDFAWHQGTVQTRRNLRHQRPLPNGADDGATADAANHWLGHPGCRPALRRHPPRGPRPGPRVLDVQAGFREATTPEEDTVTAPIYAIGDPSLASLSVRFVPEMKLTA